MNGETITTTPTHPFYVPQKGWTEAVQLRAGDILVTCNGEYVVVEQVQHEILETPVTVYNFEVEDFHTYYVAANEDAAFVLVHNKCGEPYDDFSTGRTQPNNLKEKLAMDSVKSNPHDGKVIMTKLHDSRLMPGTVKYAKNFKFFDDSAEIHYLYHKSRGFFDFKFKD